MKKILVISASILLVVGAAAAVYFWWQSSTQPTTDHQQPAPEPGAIPLPPKNSDVDARLKATGGPALAGYYLKNGAAIGLGANGQVLSIKDGSASTLNAATFNEIILEAKPSPDGRWILEKWGSGQNPRFSVYDTQNNAWTPLTIVAFESMDWSPAESRLAYLERVNGKVNLGIMDLAKKSNGGFARATVTSLNIQDVELAWVATNEILLSEKPSARVPGSVWKFKLNTHRLEPLILEQSGLWVEWDKGSGYGVRFDRDRSQNRFSLVGDDGTTFATPPFVTMPDKCAISNAALYCAVPQTPLTGKELPDDYLKRAFYTNDAFFRVDIESGEIMMLFAGAAVIDAINLQVDGNKLYFINRYDRKLYSLEL